MAKTAKANIEKKLDLIEALEAEPTEENWKRALPKILAEGKYYFTFYPNGIQGSMSLKGAYAVIYDKGYKSLYKVPLVKLVGKKGEVEGATWYLKGLEINRKMITM